MTIVVALERELDQRLAVAFPEAAVELGLDHDQMQMLPTRSSSKRDERRLNRVESVAVP